MTAAGSRPSQDAFRRYTWMTGMMDRSPSWSSMSDSRFSSRGVGAAGATSTAGGLRTVNFSPAVDVKNVAMCAF